MDLTREILPAYEIGPIRPPSEAYSLLLRVTRNCPWNRCRFCVNYKGKKFELRPVEEIKKDIDAARTIYEALAERALQEGTTLHEVAVRLAETARNDAQRNIALFACAGGRTGFLQDANSLIARTSDLLAVLGYLKDKFYSINRITTYARSGTAARKTVEELRQLRDAGLSRVHIGLESGYDPVLEFLNKGTTAEEHIRGGRNVMASGISLSEYVMPGAGGRRWWRENALETARVLNEINPDYIRLRTLTIKPQMELAASVADGSFIRADDELIVKEIRLFIENLNVTSELVSDHIINLLPEVAGKLPGDRDKMLTVIDRFMSLPQEEKDIYKLGRRLGLYERVDELMDEEWRIEVERILAQVRRRNDVKLDDILFKLMERYI